MVGSDPRAHLVTAQLLGDPAFELRGQEMSHRRQDEEKLFNQATSHARSHLFVLQAKVEINDSILVIRTEGIRELWHYPAASTVVWRFVLDRQRLSLKSVLELANSSPPGCFFFCASGSSPCCS